MTIRRISLFSTVAMTAAVLSLTACDPNATSGTSTGAARTATGGTASTGTGTAVGSGADLAIGERRIIVTNPDGSTRLATAEEIRAFDATSGGTTGTTTSGPAGAVPSLNSPSATTTQTPLVTTAPQSTAAASPAAGSCGITDCLKVTDEKRVAQCVLDGQLYNFGANNVLAPIGPAPAGC